MWGEGGEGRNKYVGREAWTKEEVKYVWPNTAFVLYPQVFEPLP